MLLCGVNLSFEEELRNCILHIYIYNKKKAKLILLEIMPIFLMSKEWERIEKI